jgi:hypothetical protein
MNTPASRASLPAVTAAGVVAIIFSLFGALVSFLGGVGFLLLPQLPQSPGAPFEPPQMRFIMVGMMLFILALSVFGIFVGVGILRRRNWARITILIWGGLMGFFCLVAVAFSLVFFTAGPGIDLPNAQGVDAAQGMAFMKVFLVIFYGIPAAVGIWWLILFTRPNVAIAFTQPTSAAATMDASGFPQLPDTTASQPKRPSCPLPLAVFAGFLLLGTVWMLFFPFVPQYSDLPFLFFGHSFHGAAAKSIFIVFALTSGVTAVGLFKLKPWALYTQIAFQFFGLLNCAATLLSPAYPAAMRAAMAKVYSQNPLLAGTTPHFSDAYFRSLLILSTLLVAALLALLLWQRPRFLEQAAAASQS